MALLWLVLITTSSPALVGLTQAAVTAPSIIVGPAAGVYADGLNRRSLMIASNVLQGGITALISALYLLNVLSFPSLVLLVLLLYSGAAFYRAANAAILPSIVPKENLGAANGLFTLSTSANQLASYTAGGVVLVTVGAAASVTYDSLTFFVAAALLTLIAKSYGNPRADEIPLGGVPHPSFRKEFLEGLSYIRSNTLFVELSIFGLAVNFFGAGSEVMVAPYVKYQLGGDAFAYAVMLVTFAAGLIVGSIVVGKVNFRAYVGKLLFASVFSFGPLAVVVGLSTIVWLSLLAFFGMGVLSGVVNLPIQVLVQTQIPRELLGRAATVLSSLLGIAQPVAAVTFGLWVGLSSTAFVFQSSGIAISVLALAFYFPFRELRDAKY